MNAGSAPNCRVHKLKLKRPTSDATVLPGGRWFLSSNGLGEVIVVDMDSLEASPKVLLRVEQLTGSAFSDTLNRFIVWVDPQEPRLTFRIALFNSGRFGESFRAFGCALCSVPVILKNHF